MSRMWFLFSHEVGDSAKAGRAHERPLLAAHLVIVDGPVTEEMAPQCGMTARMVSTIAQSSGFALACVECLRLSEVENGS